MIELKQYTDEDLISPDRIATHLRTTKQEISQTLGISPEALTRKRRIKTPAVQSSLRKFIETLNTVTPMAGNALMAYAWYRSASIIGFGGRTPAEIVKDGEADALRNHILRRLDGGYT